MEKTMDKIIALAKARGFVYPGSEIYGGLANTWDYGNLGVELKNNVKRVWWQKFIPVSYTHLDVYKRQGDKYDQHQPLDYYLKGKEKLWFIHPKTKRDLEGLLRILNDHGEEVLISYIKNVYLKKDKALERV